ncbi:hypothetical protein BJ508DRAFT_210016 [Ascobolus immersus RN42]|uniref:Uncharacterized protein n=1 Tax=Ascobolus immersus RN42 TaxID=1160509 RepID=A0A3N4I3Q4_ASCIM|nr:hypothetical protein BJ508DRAFT_210016 [Ascobolus immersus RN42]
MDEYAAQPISSANTLTEFTKRKNWPQRLLEEVPDFMHVLSPDGKIVYAAPSAKQVTGFAAEELIGKTLGDFLHDDDRGLFWRKFNACVSNEGGEEFRMFYRFRGRDGNYAVFDVTGHPHFNTIGATSQRSAGECSGFFMAARPYLQRNSELIDSFLEHRIENERLMQRVADLKREEEDEVSSYASPARTYSESTPRNDGYMGMRSPHGIIPGMSPNGVSLTKHNLDTIANVDSIGDKMHRFEGSTRTEAIEMFTGLRFADGERSKGISTGDTSPALIRGDAGVPIPLEPHHRQMGDKKKKMKMTEEYVCTDCGTLESPEWRKGPKGPKTLCNACGLRWAKYVFPFVF